MRLMLLKNKGLINQDYLLSVKISSNEDRSEARRRLAMVWDILNRDKDGLAKILRGGEFGEPAVSREEEVSECKESALRDTRSFA